MMKFHSSDNTEEDGVVTKSTRIYIWQFRPGREELDLRILHSTAEMKSVVWRSWKGFHGDEWT